MVHPKRNHLAYGCVAIDDNNDNHVEIGYSSNDARTKIQRWLYRKKRPKDRHTTATKLPFTYGYYLENRDNPLFWEALTGGIFPSPSTHIADLERRIGSGEFKKTLRHHYTHKYRKRWNLSQFL